MKKLILVACSIFWAGCAYSQEVIKQKENAHEGGVSSLEFIGEGNFLVSGGNDFKAFVWNSVSFEKQKGAIKQNDIITSLAVNTSGKFYVAGCLDNKVRMVDLISGSPVRVLAEHSAGISAVTVNPMNDFIATGSKDFSIKIWDNNVKNKTSLSTLTGHSKEVLSVKYSPDGKLLISSSVDKTVKLWNAKTYQEIASTELEGNAVNALLWHPEGRKIFAGTVSGKIVALDVNNLAKISEINSNCGNILSMALSPDGQYLAVSGTKKASLLSITDGKQWMELNGHNGSINALAFSLNGKFLVSGGQDGAIKMWKVDALKIGAPIYPKNDDLPQLAINSLTISDENGNGIIEAGEKSALNFSIRNDGKGNAYRLVAQVNLDNEISEMNFDKETILGNLAAGKAESYAITLKSGENLQAENGTFNLKIKDANGITLPSAKLNFQTGGAGSYNYIMVIGQSFSSATGKAEIGAPISLKIKIKNISKGKAKNIKVNFLLPEHVFAVNKISETIPVMEAGEEREISMEFYADKTFSLPEIKMGLDIDGAAFTNAKELILGVKLNEKLTADLDYTDQVTAQVSELELQKSETIYRGGGDPLKGLNVSKPKQMVIGNYYALIVGIDSYKGIWPVLQNASNDAKAVEKLLRNSYKFEQFKTLYNEQATRENIITAFEWLLANAKENDNVFIYYSGHGEYKKDLNKGFWVPVDATTNSTAKYISNSDIQTYISGIKGKHTLLVSDACFSGDIFRGNTISVPFEDSDKYYREVHGLSSRQALTSGGLEPVMDGGKEGHSVFAYYLLKTLGDNSNKFFDASQLYSKVKIPVINNSDQTPKFSSIKNTGDEGGQFIFIKK